MYKKEGRANGLKISLPLPLKPQAPTTQGNTEYQAGPTLIAPANLLTERKMVIAIIRAELARLIREELIKLLFDEGG